MPLAVVFVFLITPMYSPVVLAARAEEAPAQLSSPKEIAAYARKVQHAYALSNDFFETLRYESRGFLNGQSTVPNKKGPDGYEDSWGVCQIHLPAHPEITKEQAMDPEWCIDWSAEEFKKGRAWQWTGWQLIQQGVI